MNAFDPSSRAPSAPGPVGQPVDERDLRTDDDEVGLDLLRWRRRHRDAPARRRLAGHPRVAGRDDDVGRPAQRPGQRVLPAAAPDDANGGGAPH
jgi:hypothetical protein